MEFENIAWSWIAKICYDNITIWDDDEDAEKHEGDDDHGDGVTILIFAKDI